MPVYGCVGAVNARVTMVNSGNAIPDRIRSKILHRQERGIPGECLYKDVDCKTNLVAPILLGLCQCVVLIIVL